VAAKALLAMREAFGTDPKDVRAVLGPCIGPCCYEVGEDVKGQFEGVFPWAPEVFERSLGEGFKLDLASANGRQLIEVGLREVNLIRSGLCTVGHRDLFFSHRAEATSGEQTGRFGAYIGLNE
jgi:copper oxidase (laccase) domain-containing protein